VRQAIDFRGPVGHAAWWRGATEPRDAAQQLKGTIRQVQGIDPGGAMCNLQWGRILPACTTHIAQGFRGPSTGRHRVKKQIAVVSS
jgi:hypothetical protein